MNMTLTLASSRGPVWHCRMTGCALIVAFAACGKSSFQSPDAAVGADSAMIDAAYDAPQMVRVFGNVNYNGGLINVTVVTLTPPVQHTVTDANGDFYFDVADGSTLVFEAMTADRPELFPMIRGVVAHDHLRPRVMYLLGPSDVSSAQTVGVTFDSAHAIVETDFRNAQIGGYGAVLTSAGQGLSPGYGIVYDAGGNPLQQQTTAAGGDGSTLLLGGLPAGDVSFAPTVPAAATLPCLPRDAATLPLVAGVVTWFDFECGTGTD